MIRTILSLVFCALICNTAVAQQRQPVEKFLACPLISTEQLQAISDDMYAEGNYKYIWVDLWKDGYIRPDDDDLLHNAIRLVIKKEEEMLFVYDHALPKKIAEAYASKFRDFVTSVKGDPKVVNYWIHKMDFTTQQVSDESSSFRQLTIKDVMNMVYFTNEQTGIYKEMVKDGLGDDDKKIMFIQCSQISLVVNHKDAEGALYEKYKALFKEKLGVVIDFPFNRYQTQFMQFDDEHMKVVRQFRTGQQ